MDFAANRTNYRTNRERARLIESEPAAKETLAAQSDLIKCAMGVIRPYVQCYRRSDCF